MKASLKITRGAAVRHPKVGWLDGKESKDEAKRGGDGKTQCKLEENEADEHDDAGSGRACS